MKKAKISSEPQFETSRELRTFFVKHVEEWIAKNRLGLDELSKRCGVTPSYLSQVRRYGRIPSRPVLILLAYNFQLDDPAQIFRVAGIAEPWPYLDRLKLLPVTEAAQPFVSVKIELDAFKDSIRDIVQQEIRPRALGEMFRSEPLRIGLNPLNFWIFKDFTSSFKDRPPDGLFSSFCRSLALSLRAKTSYRAVDYSDYSLEFKNSGLDIYGPIISAPNLPANTVFSRPLFRIGISALGRKHKTSELADLPMPKNHKDMANTPYKIAVITNSRAHLLANTRYGRSDDELVLCSSYDEALDRIMMRGLKRSAHILLCNAVDARITYAEQKRDLNLLFNDEDSLIDVADCGVAINSAHPELLTAINDLIQFMGGTGALGELLERWRPKGMEGAIFPVI